MDWSSLRVREDSLVAITRVIKIVGNAAKKQADCIAFLISRPIVLQQQQQLVGVYQLGCWCT